MKIAIVGLGVAGSYLMRRLAQDYEVVGFERQPIETFKAVCAWGTSRHEMNRILRLVDFAFEDYVLHEGRYMHVDLGREVLHIPLKGLCTYDKHRLEMDLVKGLKAFYGVKPSLEDLVKRFDLIVDATGVARAYLPKIVGDEVIPCLEYRVDYSGAPPLEDFYIKPFPDDTGYLWYFPLDNGSGHVGAGDVRRAHIQHVEEFMRRHPGRRLVKMGRAIRFTPPSRCRPFVSGKVVGVGESIGTVFPLLGEGIIPSLHSAEILYETLPDLNEYERRILEEFEIFEDIHRLVKLKHMGKLSLVRDFPIIYRAFTYMKNREERFGLVIRAGDLRKILKN